MDICWVEINKLITNKYSQYQQLYNLINNVGDQLKYYTVLVKLVKGAGFLSSQEMVQDEKPQKYYLKKF